MRVVKHDDHDDDDDDLSVKPCCLSFAVRLDCMREDVGLFEIVRFVSCVRECVCARAMCTPGVCMCARHGVCMCVSVCACSVCVFVCACIRVTDACIYMRVCMRTRARMSCKCVCVYVCSAMFVCASVCVR